MVLPGKGICPITTGHATFLWAAARRKGLLAAVFAYIDNGAAVKIGFAHLARLAAFLFRHFPGDWRARKKMV